MDSRARLHSLLGTFPPLLKTGLGAASTPAQTSLSPSQVPAKGPFWHLIHPDAELGKPIPLNYHLKSGATNQCWGQGVDSQPRDPQTCGKGDAHHCYCENLEIWIFDTEELEDLVILGPLYLHGHSGLRPSGGHPVMKHCWLLALPQSPL